MATTRDTTLYQALARPALAGPGNRGRTERTAQVETMDRDRSEAGLYLRLGTASRSQVDIGRTEETKTIETIDRDRAGAGIPGALCAPITELYTALAAPARPAQGPGRTELTESTETVDWDRPPDR